MASPYPTAVELAANGFAALETPANEMPGTVTTVPIKLCAAPAGFRVSWDDALPGRNWIDVQVLGRCRKRHQFRATCAHRDARSQRAQRCGDDAHSLPFSREFLLRFGIHGAARLFGFSFLDIDGRQ